MTEATTERDAMRRQHTANDGHRFRAIECEVEIFEKSGETEDRADDRGVVAVCERA